MECQHSRSADATATYRDARLSLHTDYASSSNKWSGQLSAGWRPTPRLDIAVISGFTSGGQPPGGIGAAPQPSFNVGIGALFRF